MRSGAEIARYDRTACSIAGHRANEWAGCASCSKLIVPPIDTTMRQKHSARGIHILGREDGTIAIQPCSSGSVNSVGSTLPNIQSPRSAWGGASPSDGKSAVAGKRGYVRVEMGGRGTLNKNNTTLRKDE